VPKSSVSSTIDHVSRSLGTTARATLAASLRPSYIRRMQRSLAKTTTTTPGLPGAIGARVTG